MFRFVRLKSTAISKATFVFRIALAITLCNGFVLDFCTHTFGQSNGVQVAAQQKTLQRNLQGKTQSAKQQTITYAPGQISLSSSRVFVYVDKTGLGHEHGVVGQIKQGKVLLGVDQSAGQIVFDMSSFLADTTMARKYVGLSGKTDASTKKKVNKNMLGSSVLNVKKFPTASFAIQSSKLLATKSDQGLPQYQLAGEFTLHGVTQPLSFVADAEKKGNWIHLRGGFSMQQTHFGITPYSKAFGAIGVADKLKVWGDIWVAGPEGITVLVSANPKK